MEVQGTWDGVAGGDSGGEGGEGEVVVGAWSGWDEEE